MNSKWMKLTLTLMALMLSFALISCGGETATDEPVDEPADTQTTQEEVAAPSEEVAGKVGIVLPTKDEPRWVQDETRFQEALEAAGYEVEILFSQGDSRRAIGESGRTALPLSIDGIAVGRVEIGELDPKTEARFNRTHLGGNFCSELVFILDLETLATGNCGLQNCGII